MLWTGFRRSRCRGAPGPVRPVTLRRHLSMALPLSKSRRSQLATCWPSRFLLVAKLFP